jgi:DNA invertase Pin-like site-specific DNA recombinase
MTTKGIPTVAYARASTDDQEGSCPRQLKAVREYAAKNGYALLREYIDDGFSGGSAERPDFRRMVADCGERGDFDAIIVFTQDRFSRLDPADFFAAAKPFIDAGVRLVTTDEGPKDWASAIGQVMLAVGQLGKHQFLRDLSLAVTSGMVETVLERGGWPTSAPYGFTIVRVLCPGTNKGSIAKLAIDPERAEIVRELFRRYVHENTSLRALAEDLNRRGVKPQRGETWAMCTVKQMLLNPAYIGMTVFNRATRAEYTSVTDGKAVRLARGVGKRNAKGKVAVSPNDSGEWLTVEGTHDAIIEREDFDKVPALLVARRSNKGLRRAEGKGSQRYLFAGVIRCGHCGGAIQGKVSHWLEDREGDEPEYDRLGKRKKVRGHVVGRTPVLSYICNARQMKGGSACPGPYRRAYEDEVREAVADAIWHDLLMNQRKRASWERRLAEQLRAKHADAAGDLKRLEAEIADLSRKIENGHANLAELPKDMLAGVVAKVREWEERKKVLETRASQVRRGAELAGRVDAAVREAADRICSIGSALAGQEDFDHALIRENVAKIVCHFRDEVRVRVKKGRRTKCVTAVLESVRVTFKPESLLGTELAELYVSLTPLSTARTSPTRSRTAGWSTTAATT